MTPSYLRTSFSRKTLPSRSDACRQGHLNFGLSLVEPGHISQVIGKCVQWPQTVLAKRNAHGPPSRGTVRSAVGARGFEPRTSRSRSARDSLTSPRPVMNHYTSFRVLGKVDLTRPVF